MILHFLWFSEALLNLMLHFQEEDGQPYLLTQAMGRGDGPWTQLLHSEFRLERGVKCPNFLQFLCIE